MSEIPCAVSKVDEHQIQEDLKKYQDMGMELGASDTCIISADSRFSPPEAD